MTTNQITSLVRKKVLEEGTEIIDDETLLIYVNLAYQDVIKKAFPKNSVSTATIAFSGGSGTLPSDYGTLYTDALDSDKNVFPELSIADFARLNGQNGITIEGGVIKVSPTDTSSLNIKYYPSFETLTSAQNPTIDSFLHEPIVYGAISRCFEDLQDPELSKYFENKFILMLQDRINTLSNYEEDSQRGGSMFNPINIIQDNISNSDPNRW